MRTQSHVHLRIEIFTCKLCELQRVVRHPLYKNGNNLAYDLALLVLNKPVKTKPTPLAPANYKMPTGSRPGEYLFAAGWGLTEDGYESQSLK